MRNVKFRAWHKENKKMYKCYLVSFNNGQCGLQNFGMELRERIILMEYAGIKDNNGKYLDWWEGDLFQEQGGPVKQIIKEQGCFWLVWLKQPLCKIPLYSVVDWAESMKKVGNIYENTELLEEKT